MRVCVTGATGFIGRALVPALQQRGHEVIALVRSVEHARNLLGAGVTLSRLGGPQEVARLGQVLATADGVVNLAGEPIMGGRWTAARRAVLRASRVTVTEQLVRALSSISTSTPSAAPRVLVSGSAVGFYGDRDDEVLTERSAAGTGFLAELCREWESAAEQAEMLGVRVVRLRTGIVLGRDGGALAQMLPPFRLGAGGRIGSGRQYVPWIHIYDLVQLIVAALENERVRGPIDGVTHAATSLEFARALGRALHRPALVPAPAFALRAIFGAAAGVLLGSQRVVPFVVPALGVAPSFPTLDAALSDIVTRGDVSITTIQTPLPAAGAAAGAYLRARRPVYELRATTLIDAPIDEVFAFFSSPANLGALTPASMRLTLDGDLPAMADGARIRYRLQVGRLPIRWVTQIVDWQPGAGFIDLQEAGPYRAWWHEHRFFVDGARTRMEDRVYYAPPLGVLGWLANRLFVATALRRVFAYRADMIRLRFGPSSAAPPS